MEKLPAKYKHLRLSLSKGAKQAGTRDIFAENQSSQPNAVDGLNQLPASPPLSTHSPLVSITAFLLHVGPISDDGGAPGCGTGTMKMICSMYRAAPGTPGMSATGFEERTYKLALMRINSEEPSFLCLGQHNHVDVGHLWLAAPPWSFICAYFTNSPHASSPSLVLIVPPAVRAHSKSDSRKGEEDWVMLDQPGRLREYRVGQHWRGYHGFCTPPSLHLSLPSHSLCGNYCLGMLRDHCQARVEALRADRYMPPSVSRPHQTHINL